MSCEPRLRIVLTGFGPFGPHSVNPSWKAVEQAALIWQHPDHVELVIEEIPVSYSFVLENVPSKWLRSSQSSLKTILIHCGVSGMAKKILIESRAPNKGYDREDIHGQLPLCNACCPESGESILETSLDVDSIVRRINESESVAIGAERSSDAGNYLCAFVYFQSLLKMKQEALFVHVPDLWQRKEDVDMLANALVCVLDHVALQDNQG